MTVKKFNLPDVGEGLTEAEIVSWKVKAGDTVAVNDVLCEIETAKSLVELPSPYAGTVTELLVPEGVTVDVGTPIISVSDAPAGQPAAPTAAAPSVAAPAAAVERAGIETHDIWISPAAAADAETPVQTEADAETVDQRPTLGGAIT